MREAGPHRLRITLIRAGLGIAACLPLAAQQDVSSLRADFERAAAAATRSLVEAHQLALRELEAQRAEEGDYEGALRARQLAEALENPVGNPATVQPSGITLPASHARPQGASHDRSRDSIELRRAGAAAIWELVRLEPGTYDVWAVYAVGAPQPSGGGRAASSPATTTPPQLCGGRISLSEATSLTPGGSGLQRQVTSTGGWDNYVRGYLGRQEFRTRSLTLKLQADSSEPGGVMRLRGLLLAPALGEAGASLDALRPLRDLQKAHAEAMSALRQSGRQRLEGQLRDLENELFLKGDIQSAAAVARERQELSRSSMPSPAGP